ncbi:hypothetical protein B0J13DRAFT_524481 [Dactylonectria estremocensis]|uniref:Uncharacterized protein n=1 Tax=Dactylonectria estremocensis TaxID=1079267 RepID=A0A9P9J907_9HYPO|nr:hypothetical protein B0J13DRAFT_524481 [Dactylonectria estremocensis]
MQLVLSTRIDPSLRPRPPNVNGKPVLNVDNLLVILMFNITRDTTVFPGERHGVRLASCYQFLYYTEARPAELVDAERRKPKDGYIEELFGRKVVKFKIGKK